MTKAASQISRITMNFAPKGKVPKKVLNGELHYVVPTVLLREGVFNGSKGPLLYEEADLAPTPVVWNHKPIVVNHPEIDGEGVSACDPDILNECCVGVLLNCSFDETEKKLKGESWLKISSLRRVCSKIANNLENGIGDEVSTGLFTDVVPTAGTYDGKEYVGIARNHRPDHLALLPDTVGACSRKDGAGLIQNKNPMTKNELGFNNIQSQLQKALDKRFKPVAEAGTERRWEESPWVRDVFSSFVIYGLNDKLYKLSYTKNDDIVLLGEEDPEEVVLVSQYKTVASGSFVGNAGSVVKETKETLEMTREELVASLISNKSNKWTESDRPFLLQLNENQLQKMMPEEAPASSVVPPVVTNPPEAQIATNKGAENTGPSTLQGWLNMIPDPTAREYIQNSVEQSIARHQSLIANILKAPSNLFSEEELKKMPIKHVEHLASMVANQSTSTTQAPVSRPAETAPINFFGGAQGHVPTMNASSASPLPVLTLPVFNLEKGGEKTK